MRLLIDECVDERLRLLFPGHGCQTARFANLVGLKNGQLLDAAEAAGFDILITVDQNIPDQQDLAGRRISLMILCGPTNRLRDLELLAPAAVAALRSIGRGDVVTFRRKNERLKRFDPTSAATGRCKNVQNGPPKHF
jgi:predicted nuclease of predicted toxin-antitoxin system